MVRFCEIVIGDRFWIYADDAFCEFQKVSDSAGVLIEQDMTAVEVQVLTEFLADALVFDEAVK